LQIITREAQAEFDARTKERDAAQATQDALAKQLDESQKALEAATAARRDAEAILARAEESIVGTTKAVHDAKQLAEQSASRLAAQEHLQATAVQQAHDVQPRFAVASFSPNGERLMLADTNGQAFVYDTQQFAPLSAWQSESNLPVAASFVDDDNFVVVTRDSTGAGKTVGWSASPAWRLERSIGGPDDSKKFADRVLSLDFSPDGSLLAVGDGDPSRSGQITIWKVADGSLVRSINQPHSDTVNGLSFSPDGEYLASASADRTMKVFRTADGELVHTFEGHTDHVTGVSWRANGKQLATCGADQKIKIWDFISGEQQRTIDAGGKEVTSVHFIGTGGRLVSSCGDRNVRMHNADDGAVVRTFSGAAAYLFCCAATETGNMVLAGGADRVLRVWNGEDGKELLKIE
jgi:WD40 repeat protein